MENSTRVPEARESEASGNVRKAMIMASAAMAINALATPADASPVDSDAEAIAAKTKGKTVKKAPKKPKKKRVTRGKKRRPRFPDDGFSMPAGTLYDVIGRSDLD